MIKNKSELIGITELQNSYQSEHLVLIDARGGKNARGRYLEKHLDGALFVDLNKDLSDIKDNFADGGRHPLPTIPQFSKLLTSLGITTNSHVVVYDDKNGAIAASRFWWMLKSIGHSKVQVLNGGFAEAEKVRFPMSSKEENPKLVGPYEIEEWKLPQSTIEEVEKISEDKDYLVIDVRAPKRYRGEIEPIDLVAGHIPGAVNVPFSTNLADDGLFLSASELRTKYQKVIGERPMDKVIIHCGSGVTACHSLLGIAEAQIDSPKLYVGSWSEWSRNGKTIMTDLEE